MQKQTFHTKKDLRFMPYVVFMSACIEIAFRYPAYSLVPKIRYAFSGKQSS